MNVQHAPTAMIESRERHSYARLQGRWLLLARGTWITLIILTLAIFLASLPAYISQLQTPCAGSACGFQQLTPEQAGTLKGIGLFPGVYTAFTLALTLATLVVFWVVSTVIVLRRSDDRMALIVALMLVTVGSFAVSESVSASLSPWQVPNEYLNFLFVSLFQLVFSLFPTGQFVPHWMRWTIVVFIAVNIPFSFLTYGLFTLTIYAVSLGYLLFLGEAAILVIVQLYRYRRVSSPLQRQQTKWVVFGFALPIIVYIIGIVPYLIFPVLAVPGSLYLPAFLTVQDFLFLLIPLSFGFAMLRYRLWDIDVLINRTLVYGALTVILTGVYVGLIIGLQALLGGFIRQDNGVAIVISTLAIYALFQPLRRRIQRVIDRRFYRHKYDAAKTLAAFSATLRQEVDLATLSEHLRAVVQETMQPAHVSLWLRPSENHQNKRATRVFPKIGEQVDSY
jgi:divalent metal cation (Fe/Co/Zn/Cd) transporter